MTTQRPHQHKPRPAQPPRGRLAVPGRDVIRTSQPKKTASITKRDVQSLHKRLAKSAHRAMLLDTPQAAHLEIVKSSWRERLFTKQAAFSGLAVVTLLFTGYVSVDTWLTNRQVEAQFVQPAKANDAALEHTPEREGRDESEPAPDLLANHTVAADQPRALYVDKINVSARLMQMGVNPDGAMQAPINIFDAGWYKDSAVPSRAGAVVINAHASGPTRLGLFAYLNTLEQGDEITVETGDMTRYTYRVVAKETVDLDDVDMEKLMLPHGTLTHGANFITCDGEWLQNDETYSQRTIVYTELIED